MFEITPGLYLGDAKDSRNLEIFEEKKILLAINATRLDVGFHPDLPKKITRIRIPIDDDGNREHDLDLFLALPYVVYRIDIHLYMGHSVIVFCAKGRQRSCAVIASYLIWKFGISVKDSIEFMQQKKREAFFPEPNFIRTLQMWHARCTGCALPDFSSSLKQSTFLVS